MMKCIGFVLTFACVRFLKKMNGISSLVANTILFGVPSRAPVKRSYMFSSWLHRNQAALLAFTLPENWQSGSGLSIVATHVDSPNLRIRPMSKKSSAGYLQVTIP
jgi:hypothetical protein